MRLYALILLLAASLSLPLSGVGADACARCGPIEAMPSEMASDGPSALAGAERCCRGERDGSSESGDRPSDEAPVDQRCDGCDCPMSCCAGMHLPMAPPRAAAGFGPAHAVAQLHGVARILSGSPHLSGLKRPPRLTTSA